MTGFENVSDHDLIASLKIASSFHDFLERVLERPIDKLNEWLALLYEESEKRGIKVFENGKITSFKDIEKKKLNRIICGALKMCLDSHGPITQDKISSVAKRMLGFLLREL